MKGTQRDIYIHIAMWTSIYGKMELWEYGNALQLPFADSSVLVGYPDIRVRNLEFCRDATSINIVGSWFPPWPINPLPKDSLSHPPRTCQLNSHIYVLCQRHSFSSFNMAQQKSLNPSLSQSDPADPTIDIHELDEASNVISHYTITQHSAQHGSAPHTPQLRKVDSKVSHTQPCSSKYWVTLLTDHATKVSQDKQAEIVFKAAHRCFLACWIPW